MLVQRFEGETFWCMPGGSVEMREPAEGTGAGDAGGAGLRGPKGFEEPVRVSEVSWRER